MPRRATLRIPVPSGSGANLYLHGYCPDEQLRNGPLTVTVTIDGSTHSAAIQPGENSFDLTFPLPGPAAGKTEMQVAVEVAHTFRPPSDQRDLGLSFGVFEVR